MLAFKDLVALCSASLAVGRLAAAAPITAGGVPLTAGFPRELSTEAAHQLQFLQFYENMESAFFSAGASNLTKWNSTAHAGGEIDIVSKMSAQKQARVSSYSNMLNNYHATVVAPCKYTFPVNNAHDFFSVGHIITSMGVGAYIGAEKRLAHSEPWFLGALASMLATEARYDVFFGDGLGDTPAPTPYDTGSTDVWVYNLMLNFILPGSCAFEPALPLLPTLTSSNIAGTAASNGSQSFHAEFTWDPAQEAFIAQGSKTLYIGWINQLSQPIYSPLQLSEKGRGAVSVPTGIDGTAFAVVTAQQYDNIADLASGTLAGPVLTFLG